MSPDENARLAKIIKTILKNYPRTKRLKTLGNDVTVNLSY